MFRFDEWIGVRGLPELEMSRKAIKRARKAARRKRASANLVVDIGGTCQVYPTLNLSGGAFPGSGAIIGNSVDMLNSDTLCNVVVVGQALGTSGQLRIQVQCSDSDTSGNFTDPTSGLATFPTSFQSGGILIINSGGIFNGVFASGTSGQFVQSGFAAAGGFQRPDRAGRFFRANTISGDFYWGPLSVTAVSQNKTTGSGGGFSLSPTSGTVNV